MKFEEKRAQEKLKLEQEAHASTAQKMKEATSEKEELEAKNHLGFT